MKKHFIMTAIKLSLAIILTISLFSLSLPIQPIANAASKLDTSEPVELTWYVPGNCQQADTDLVEEAVNEYLKDKINVTLNLKTRTWGSDFENFMLAKVAAGENFDITFTANWAMNYKEYSEMGAFVDITHMLDTYAPKTKALLGKNILKGAEINGKIYAIPTYNSTFAKTSGIVLSKSLVQKYKVDTSKIKKLEDLEATLKIIKAKEPKMLGFYPFDYYGTDSIYKTLNYEKVIDSKIPGAVKKDGKSTKVINDFESSEAKSLFNLINKWYKSGYINKSTVADSNYFEKNKSKIFAMYSNLYPTQDQEYSKHYYGSDVIHIALTKPSLETNNITGAMQAISSSSKNPELALMFLELMNTDEKLSNLINFGIEGIHYEKINQNTQSSLYPDSEYYNPGTSWVFGNMSLAYLYPNQDSSMWTKIKKNIDNAVPSPLLGFTFNSKPVDKQVLKLESITNKYYNDLCIGKTNPSVTLPKMNKELKNAGLQKVLTEMQKQVDTFKKKK